MNQLERTNYVVEMYQKINSELKVTPDTKIKNTSIWMLCQNEGAPYQRIKDWLEKKISELPKEEKREVDGDVELFQAELQKCFDLMCSRNAKYGSSWKQLRVSSMVDLMAMKLDRCKNQNLENKAMTAEMEDIVNYGVFCLLSVRDK